MTPENPDQIVQTIEDLIVAEVQSLDVGTRSNAILVADFDSLREDLPQPLQVQFSGGVQQTCWRVTRSNGAYSLVFMPAVGYFSLCADSALGLLDIGVHGPALRCFSSV